MKFKKLRIAWSVVCGIACMLLIVLWVWSYWYVQNAVAAPSTDNYLVIEVAKGEILILGWAPRNDNNQPLWTSYEYPIELWDTPAQLVDASWHLFMPCWFPTVLCGVFIAAPWFRWHC